MRPELPGCISIQFRLTMVIVDLGISTQVAIYEACLLPIAPSQLHLTWLLNVSPGTWKGQLTVSSLCLLPQLYPCSGSRMRQTPPLL